MNIPATCFLGWSAPACVLVARRLRALDTCDPNRPLLVVVPTRDAVRLLREQLAVEAAGAGGDGAFICPPIIAAGELADGQTADIAPPPRQLAALSSVRRRESARFPQLAAQASGWSEGDFLARAGQFRQLYSTLCYEGVPADGSSEAARRLAAQNPLWQELFALYPLYLDELHRHGRRAPAEAPLMPLAPGTCIILACIPSLPERAVRLLAASPHAVEVWLHADELHQGPEWFDAWGRPTPSWLATPAEDVLVLGRQDWPQRFLVCGDLERMAAETALAAGRAQGPVAVGVCDPGMEAAVAEAFARHGMRAVRPRGVPFSATGWNRLLLTLTRQAELLEQTGREATQADGLSAELVSALLRNPVVTDGLLIEDAAALAAAADRLMRRSLPASLGMMKRLADAPLRRATDRVGDWLAGCLGSVEALLEGLTELAAMQLVEGAPAGLEEAYALAAQFTEQVDAGCRLLRESPWVSGLSVLSTLHLLASAIGPANAPHPAGALSLRGWLELSYAPEEQLVLAGLHDGIVPERWPANPYLTPPVIEALEMPRNEQRAARDAYLLRCLYACRPAGAVQAVFTLLNARRDPLFPSSCFFRLTPQKSLPAFVAHFFDRRRPCPATPQLPYDSSGWAYHRLALPTGENDIAALARLTLHELGLANPMEGRALSPSTLRQFLACPLRFWLQKLNGMRDDPISPAQRDLAPNDIGTCLHDALERFARRYPSRTDFLAASPGDIPGREELTERVEQELDRAFLEDFESKYGKPELLPRRFQCAAMRRRLAGFAPVQVQLWEEGWECARNEAGEPMLEYEVNETLFGHPLRFRIDRIDRRPCGAGYEYRVIDYKTGDVTTCYRNHLETLPPPHARTDLHLLHPTLEPAVGPGKNNSKHDELRWKDLQLPLYTAWAQEHFSGSLVNSAYIYLSRNPGATRLLAWGDSDKDPDFFAPRLVKRNAKYPEDVEAEPLFDNALRWIRFALDALAAGRCFVSAEMMTWEPPKESRDIFGDILEREPLARALLAFPGQY